MTAREKFNKIKEQYQEILTMFKTDEFVGIPEIFDTFYSDQGAVFLDTGGNIKVTVIPLSKTMVAGIGEDSIVLYQGRSGQSPEEIFDDFRWADSWTFDRSRKMLPKPTRYEG